MAREGRRVRGFSSAGRALPTGVLLAEYTGDRCGPEEAGARELDGGTG